MQRPIYMLSCTRCLARFYLLTRSQKRFPSNFVRNYASRQSTPGFGSSRPPSRGPSLKSHCPDANQSLKSSQGADKNGAFKEPPRPLWFRTFRRIVYIGPWKFVLFSITALGIYYLDRRSRDPHSSLFMNPRFFTPFILEERERVSSTSCILHIYSPPKGQNTKDVLKAWKTGVWSVQVMQPDLQIARAYTPLPPLDNSEPEQLRLLVRQEPQGEVSTMLHKISRGTFVHMRGPHVGYEIPEDVDEILFIAGGTGIAPALQVAHTLYKARQLSSDALPRMRILWANRRREDSLRNPSPPSLSPSPIQQPPAQSPLVQEIEVLRTKFSGNVAVDYFVDEEGSYITEGLLRDYLSRVQLSNPPHTDSRRGKNIILVSGPDGFVNFYAGPKSMKSGKELQGPLGGMLQKISPDSWDVWKL